MSDMHTPASCPSIAQSPDYEVVGIVEPDTQLRQQAEAQAVYRDLPWMTQEQLLHVPGLEAVLVETRVRDLLDTAEACVAAGKHIHLDKPAGESLPQFRRILDSAATQKLLVQMGYMYRYNPAIILLREFFRQGWLGEVFEVHAVMSKVVDPVDRRQLAEYRGGMLFELGCHILDLVIGVLGRPERVTAFAQHVSADDDTLLDNMLAVLTYPRALATIKSSALEVEGFAQAALGGLRQRRDVSHPAAGQPHRSHVPVAAARAPRRGNSRGDLSEVRALRRRRGRHGQYPPRREGNQLPLRSRLDGPGEPAAGLPASARYLTPPALGAQIILCRQMRVQKSVPRVPIRPADGTARAGQDHSRRVGGGW